MNSSFPRLKADPLHKKAEEAILELMEEKGSNRLDSEEDLARELGVSRTTVRQAMNNLLQKGFISKRKGKGNFLLKSVAGTKMRIDIFNDFTRMIADAGFEPVIERRIFGFQEPSEDAARRLPLKQGEKILSFIWDCRADETPAVLDYVQVPESLIKRMPDDNIARGDDIINLDFYGSYADEDLSHYIIDIKPVINEEMCRIFGIDHRTPLITWQQCSYNINDQVISYSDIFFNPRVMDLKLVLNI